MVYRCPRIQPEHTIVQANIPATISEVNLSALVYRQFHADFFSGIRTNVVFVPMIEGEIFMKQSVNKCR